MKLGEVAGRTDAGRVRRRNEDALVLEPPLFAVADGMGGAAAGEVASRLAVAALREYRDADELGPEERVRALVREANRRIYERAESDSEATGMGTTMTVALVAGDGVTIGHVGDSRAYRIRDGRLEQLTDDHSLVADLVRSGRLTAEEAEAHPQRSVITRALGTDADVDVDTVSVDAAAEDLFLLCSDGLTTMVADEDILRTIRKAGTLEDAARDLVRAANRGGGEDNVTVVLFTVADDPPAEDTLVTETVPAAQAPGDELEDTLTGMPPVATVSPAPARAAAPRRRRRWGRRLLLAAVFLGFVALLLGGALYGLSRAYFVGADADGNLTVYQGVPFDVTGDVGLYRERYVSPVHASQLSPEEREELFDHDLVSYERALGRVTAYESEAIPGRAR